jgi:hypothetical protein
MPALFLQLLQILRYGQVLGARLYAWARPVRVEAGAELLARGRQFATDWTARYALFLPIFSVADVL